MFYYNALLYIFGVSVLLTFVFGIIVYFKITRKLERSIFLSTPAPPIMDQLIRGHFYTFWISINKQTYQSITGQELGSFDFRGNTTTFDLVLSILNTINNFLLLGSGIVLLGIEFL
jgi:hypothetical protein